jgi:TPR repeat protein
MFLLCLAITIAVGSSAWAQTHVPAELTPIHATLSSTEISQLQTQAENGDASAQVALGAAYESGNGVPQDAEQAVEWYRKAADQGNATAENDLGVMYWGGLGVERNKEEAVRWYHKAAKLGNPRAMFNLGASYYNGEGAPSNVFLAYAWFLLAQDAGDAAANDAVPRTAAGMSARETADTLLQISDMFEKGEELLQNDAEAVKWYRKAAKSDSRARVLLATHLINGSGVQQNFSEAMDLCRSAAKNYAPGNYCVGYLYRNGLGVGRDSVEAVKWYQKAAATRHVKAMLELAEMYSAGEGTGINRPEAFLCFFRAAQANAKDARRKASALLLEMNRNEHKDLEKKLRQQSLDPKKVFEALQNEAAGNAKRTLLR